MVKTAQFRHRPDSVKPASALGSFDGRVIDADTKEPIEKALVWCSWAFVRGVGDAAPEAVRTASTRTDADGRYHLPRLRDLPSGLSTRLARFSLVIYQQGYVAYRHNRVFGGRARRRDFSQVNNTVRLVRWSPELSRARHVLFIGSSPALQAASAAEVKIAARQLDSGPRTRADVFDQITRGLPAVAPRPAPAEVSQAKRLLTSDDVRGVTGFPGAFTRTKLVSAGDALDTLHLRAVDRPERYDVALRLWRLSGTELTAKYEALLAALPSSSQKDEIGDRSFVVSQGEIRALGFMQQGRSALVLLTCGKGQCTELEHLLKLAKTIEGNLAQLPARKEAP